MMNQPSPTILPISEPGVSVGGISALMEADKNGVGLSMPKGPLRPEPVNMALGDPYVVELDRQIMSIFMPMASIMFGGGPSIGDILGGFNGA